MCYEDSRFLSRIVSIIDLEWKLLGGSTGNFFLKEVCLRSFFMMSIVAFLAALVLGGYGIGSRGQTWKEPWLGESSFEQLQTRNNIPLYYPRESN